jgi:hypothetical protein
VDRAAVYEIADCALRAERSLANGSENQSLVTELGPASNGRKVELPRVSRTGVLPDVTAHVRERSRVMRLERAKRLELASA